MFHPTIRQSALGELTNESHENLRAFIRTTADEIRIRIATVAVKVIYAKKGNIFSRTIVKFVARAKDEGCNFTNRYVFRVVYEPIHEVEIWFTSATIYAQGTKNVFHRDIYGPNFLI